jgi:hypothetical protein
MTSSLVQQDVFWYGRNIIGLTLEDHAPKTSHLGFNWIDGVGRL